jgi:photosystem II stability/assembly factor-like uncharacterized protein
MLRRALLRGGRLEVALAAALLAVAGCGYAVVGGGSSARRLVRTATLELPGGAFSVATGAGAAWVATGDRLLRVDPRTDRASVLMTATGASLDEVAYGAGSVWAGTPGGVLRVELLEGRVLNKIPVAHASSLTFGAGALWAVAFVRGQFRLARVDVLTDQLRTFPLPFGKVHGVAAGYGSVWVSMAGPGCASCVLRIDPRTGRVLARVRSGDLFGSMAAGDGALWVSDGVSVARIDPRTDRVLAVISLAPQPAAGGSAEIATAPGVVWTTVSTGTTARVVRIDPATNRLIAGSLSVRPQPDSLAASGQTVWIVSAHAALTRIDLVRCPSGRCPTPAPPAPRSPPEVLLWLSSLQMVTGRIGWGLGSTLDPTVLDGAVVRTTDQGSTWRDLTPRGARTLLESDDVSAAVFALDVRRAWFAVSLRRRGALHTWIYRTADSGRAWSAPVTVATVGPPKALDFIDPQRGWMLAEEGAAMGEDAVAVYGTQDAGRHWSLLAKTASLLGAQAGASLPVGCEKGGVSFVSSTTGWISGWCNGDAPYLEVTHDGGRDWAPQPLPRLDCPDGCGASPPRLFGSTGFLTVSGSVPALLVTHDGGASWSPARLPEGAGRFPQIEFVDARHGFLVAGAAEGVVGHDVYQSADGGHSWILVGHKLHLPEPGIQFDFTTPRFGVAWVGNAAVGVPPIFQTSDGGRSWRQTTPRLLARARSSR